MCNMPAVHTREQTGGSAAHARGILSPFGGGLTREKKSLPLTIWESRSLLFDLDLVHNLFQLLRHLLVVGIRRLYADDGCKENGSGVYHKLLQKKQCSKGIFCNGCIALISPNLWWRCKDNLNHPSDGGQLPQSTFKFADELFARFTRFYHGQPATWEPSPDGLPPRGLLLWGERRSGQAGFKNVFHRFFPFWILTKVQRHLSSVLLLSYSTQNDCFPLPIYTDNSVICCLHKAAES